VERPDDLPEVLNDLDRMQPGQLDIHERPENLAKLQHRLDNYNLYMLAGARPGKKCLVLDIDYTIYNLGAVVETSVELRRPHLLEFLTSAYDHYDLVIWSANSYKWIKLKMEEMQVFNNPNFKISCCLDHGAMIGLHSSERGLFSCKPLQVMWSKVDEYTPENTIMVCWAWMCVNIRVYVYVRVYVFCERETFERERECVCMCVYVHTYSLNSLTSLSFVLTCQRAPSSPQHTHAHKNKKQKQNTHTHTYTQVRRLATQLYHEPTARLEDPTVPWGSPR
jgi:HAD-superfamily hydrolase (TIGR02245 family)